MRFARLDGVLSLQLSQLFTKLTFTSFVRCCDTKTVEGARE